jgi:hypothetical protein
LRSVPVKPSDPTATALVTAEALAHAGIPHALYGGLLLAAYGEPRETQDADFAVVSVTAPEVQSALRTRGVDSAITFEGVVLGGVLVDRLALLGNETIGGINVLDLVRPRSQRYRSAALRRALTVPVRDRMVSALSPEDFILFKLLSTRDRDLRDAVTVLRKTGVYLNGNLISREVALLAGEVPDSGIRERLGELVRLSEDPRERELGEGLGGEVHEMPAARWKRLKSATRPPARRKRKSK